MSNFCQEKNKNICSLNFSTENGRKTYTLEELQQKTVKQLRKLAKSDKISLQSVTKKHDIIQIMYAHYLRVEQSLSSDVALPTGFEIITDSQNNVNVSVWFKKNTRALERCLNLKRFKQLLKEYCDQNNTQPKDVLLWKDNNQLYLPPVLAVFVASYLSPKLHYDILVYCLYGKIEEVRANCQATIDVLKQEVVLAQLGHKLKSLSWVNFDAPYAFYWIYIDGIVKIGAVGTLNRLNEFSKQNLNARLATHRSTYARFKLLGIIRFNSSSEVTHFENWMKMVLASYSIGSETLLEQYECCGGDVEQVISQIIINNLQNLSQDQASLYDQDLIDTYNYVAQNRLKN